MEGRHEDTQRRNDTHLHHKEKTSDEANSANTFVLDFLLPE
jgi:hypothetical protein